jgi:hypothetical protein
VHRRFHRQLGSTFWGVATVTTDRGTQFTSTLWTGACTSLGIKHVLTTAYQPQSNGSACTQADQGCPTWHAHLPWVLMGLREHSDVSSAELVNGSPLIVPVQLLHVPDPQRVDVHTATHRTSILRGSHQHSAGSPSPGRTCYMHVGGQQKPLAAPYAGPYLVVSKGAKTFTIQVGQRQEIIFMDRLKAHTSPSRVSSAEAVSRGRPPKTPAPLLQSSLRLCEAPDCVGGGLCGGSYRSLFKYIFVVCVSLLWRQ